jgi:hypothetical protein
VSFVILNLLSTDIQSQFSILFSTLIEDVQLKFALDNYSQISRSVGTLDLRYLWMNYALWWIVFRKIKIICKFLRVFCIFFQININLFHLIIMLVVFFLTTHLVHLINYSFPAYSRNKGKPYTQKIISTSTKYIYFHQKLMFSTLFVCERRDNNTHSVWREFHLICTVIGLGTSKDF